MRAGSKAALLKAAKELFSLKGYAAVSTREIADQAGVNLGAITYHFGSKAKLFIETVTGLMEERAERNRCRCKDTPIASRADAAVELCAAVRGMLLERCGVKGPDACRLMYREVHSATSEDPEIFEPLMESVVENYMRPFYSRLSALVQSLQQELSKEESEFTVHSILGQCSVYVTHQPFLNRLQGSDTSERGYLLRAAEQICRMTLRGLGLSESEIHNALEKVAEYETGLSET
ncbi:MAG: CerR family C-terminal domain-containing protein [Bdellovibrionales bacterium]|nr:CerR family C-terminal domain-containing protein [Bdellovibrionales bacterium]